MTRATARNNAGLFFETYQGQTSNTGFPVDFQDLCSHAMDQALGIEKASLATVVNLNATALQMYSNSLFVPAFGELLDTAAKAFALYINLQMTWLVLLFPQAKVGTEALVHFAEPAAASSPAERTAEEVEHGVDVTLGRGNAA